jgi:hypothetical protein
VNAMRSYEPSISNENGIWTVAAAGPLGRIQKYECCSKEQAERLAQLLRIPPRARPARSERATTPSLFTWMPRLLALR